MDIPEHLIIMLSVFSKPKMMRACMTLIEHNNDMWENDVKKLLSYNEIHEMEMKGVVQNYVDGQNPEKPSRFKLTPIAQKILVALIDCYK